jgi:hypothetical protein
MNFRRLKRLAEVGAMHPISIEPLIISAASLRTLVIALIRLSLIRAAQNASPWNHFSIMVILTL